VTHLWNFGTSLISGTVHTKKLKFGTQIERQEQYRRNAKLGQSGSRRGGHVTHFLQFWDPLYIFGMVQATNVKCGMQNAKLGQSGCEGNYVTHILDFWDPCISREQFKVENFNLARTWDRIESHRGHVTHF